MCVGGARSGHQETSSMALHLTVLRQDLPLNLELTGLFD